MDQPQEEEVGRPPQSFSPYLICNWGEVKISRAAPSNPVDRECQEAARILAEKQLAAESSSHRWSSVRIELHFVHLLLR